MKNRLFTLFLTILYSTILTLNLPAMKRPLEGGNTPAKKIQKLSNKSDETGDPEIKSESASDKKAEPTSTLDTTSRLTPSEKRNYSINVMWINKTLNEDQLYIHPSLDEDDLYKNLLSPILGWASLNPESVVNLWFDSEVTPSHAVENTRIVIEEMCAKNPNIAPIKLKDIRKLVDVSLNSEVFSDPRIPVYFRADLARVIATLEWLYKKRTTRYFVYADLDVEPLSEEDLFDTETQKNLDRYGITLAYNPRGFENSFHIVSNHKYKLLEAIEYLIVELSLKRAKNALWGQFYNCTGQQPYDCQTGQKSSFIPLQQAVYDSYQPMIQYFYHLEGYGVLRANIDGSNYDRKTHKLEPFGLNRVCSGRTSFEDTTPEKSCINKLGDAFLPTKKILTSKPISHSYC